MAAVTIPPANTPSGDSVAAGKKDVGSKAPAHTANNGSALCRSPHPYHLRGISLLHSQMTGHAEGHFSKRTGEPLGASSSSESGAEADDERGRLLKGLPAPPRRPHKGLRNAPYEDLTPQPSPLQTPSQIESDCRHFSWPTTRQNRNGSVDYGPDFQAAREKYTKRKRLELVRRTTETVLFFAIGFVVVHPYQSDPWLLAHRSAIVAELVMVVLLYLSYPIRLAIKAIQARRAFMVSVKQGFTIPPRFDVAPLLYPVFLPLLVSICLGPASSHLLLANISLGLSSLPPETVPLYYYLPNLNEFHWLLTVLPCSFASRSESPSFEMVTLTFPLYVYTILTLRFLTTTSLDDAEVRLLGSSLVNIYCFAHSPQSEILKALLWLGAILLFILCRKPLQWELALARIPAWRFRDNSSRSYASPSLLQSLDKSLCEAFVGLATGQKAAPREDSEDELSNQPRLRSSRTTPAFPLTMNGLFKRRTTDSLDRSCAAASALPGRPSQLDHGDDSISSAKTAPQRRHTLSVTEQSLNKHRRTTPNGRPKRSLTPKSQSFVALRPVQAAARKAAYAAFVYAATLVIILGPVKAYVGVRSLKGWEPAGWAMGYLLGDIPQFRAWVSSAGLEEQTRNTRRNGAGWVEALRQDRLGSANVRLTLIVYWLAVLLLGLVTVHKLRTSAEVDTRRKVFHGMMVVMLCPTIYIDPCYISLALILILAVFLLLDLFRACQLPPISKPLTTFLAPYVDGRDHRGPVVVSHVFLLIGCAIPLWLSLSAVPRIGQGSLEGWEVEMPDVSMVSGVICVGMGDAAASLVGRRYGRHKWYWGGGKSLEGSLAFAMAVTVGLISASVWLRLGGWEADSETSPLAMVAKAMLAASGASLTESVLTGANDNVVVPVTLWLLVRGLGL